MARYHSLHATKIPDGLSVTATVGGKMDDGVSGVVMAVEHKTLPIAAVQVSSFLCSGKLSFSPNKI